MKRILLITMCVAITACATRDYVPSGYALEAYSGAPFKVTDKVWVYNATPSRVEKVGTLLHSDLRNWGRQLAYGLEYNLKSRGAQISRNAKRKISVQVTHAAVENKLFKYTAYMECVIRLGNGYAEKITAYNSAEIDTEACSGLLPVVIEKIMSRPAVVRYLRAGGSYSKTRTRRSAY